jgi:hypothetical protein
MIEMGIAAIIARRAFKAGGDDVPSRAAVADLVERGELPRDIIGLPVARCQRRDEADARRVRGYCGQQRQRLQPVEEMRRGVRRDERAVDDEDKIASPGKSGSRQLCWSVPTPSRIAPR